MSNDPEWIEQVRADLRQRKDVDEFRNYKHAAPLCDKHQPNGGTRGVCVICAGESLQHALSRISYACEPPNEMQCSSYDVHMDETAVVAQVETQAERIRVLREALEIAKNGLTWWQESCPELVTECDHEAMTQIDSALEATK